MSIVIKVENIFRQYRSDNAGLGSLSRDPKIPFCTFMYFSKCITVTISISVTCLQ
jgi:hypothetical protein